MKTIDDLINYLTTKLEQGNPYGRVLDEVKKLKINLDKSSWHRVEEMLPTNERLLVVMTAMDWHNPYSIVFYVKGVFFTTSGFILDNVTHWRYLDKPKDDT